MKKLYFAIFLLFVLALLRIDSVCRVDTQRADTVLSPLTSAEIEPYTVFRGEVDRLYLKSLGEFKISFYCPCEKCCGKSDGITKTGTIAAKDRTVAVDPNKIPYGSILYIDGQRYIAEDCGLAIKENRIDIFCESHSQAIQNGTYYTEVFMEVHNADY